MSKQDNLIVVAVTKDKLQEAYHGCVGMAEVFPAWFKKQNFEGQGEQDAKECKEHLLTAANACLMLLNVMTADAKEAADGQAT